MSQTRSTFHVVRTALTKFGLNMAFQTQNEELIYVVYFSIKHVE
jgi:hypothetical protein